MGENSGSDSEHVLPKFYTVHAMLFQVVLCPIRTWIFSFKKKNEFLYKAPWLLPVLIKNSQSAICRGGKPGVMQLGSLYKQNKTPKKGNKKADKQWKLSHKAHTYLPPLKCTIKKAESAANIMTQSFEFYGKLYLRYSGEGKKVLWFIKRSWEWKPRPLPFVVAD